MTLLSFLRRLFGVEPFSGTAPKPAVKPNFKNTIIEVALGLERENIRESEGKNRGPGIRRFWGATSFGFAGYEQRQPWCAAAAAWNIAEAASKFFGGKGVVPFSLPRSARVVDWPTWARANSTHWKVLSPKNNEAQAGDIIGWDFNGDDPSGTHMGIVLSDERADGTFTTGEGNTDPDGSREGNGYYLKKRTRSKAIYLIRWVG